MLAGIGTTLALSAISIVCGVALGVVLAVLKVSQNRLVRLPAIIYVDLVRAVPPIILLTFFLFALPILYRNATGDFLRISPFFAAAVGLSFWLGAVLTDVIYGGILAVPSGQLEAALSSGMTRNQALRRVILPQAVWKMLPPITSWVMILIKGTAITSTLGVTEVMARTQIVAVQTNEAITALCFGAAIYFCLTFPLAKLSAYLYQRSLRWS